ncbi:hypothetical protein ABZP36_026495 [Zizania latifolia]
MGGLGLFLEPGGRPRGRRLPITTAPSLGSALDVPPVELAVVVGVGPAAGVLGGHVTLRGVVAEPEGWVGGGHRPPCSLVPPPARQLLARSSLS